MASSDQLIIASEPVPHVRLLKLNRPAKRNALSQATIDALLHQLSAAAAKDTVRVVIITGEGPHFSAGADIKEIASLDAAGARKARYLEDLCTGLSSFRKPIIAAVEGVALGGGFELALLCDVIVASGNAMLGLPEVKLGLLPGAGGSQRLTAAIGKYRAMKTILTGEPIPAAQASEMGLVSALSPPGAALQTALELAGQMLGNSATAMEAAKEAVLRSNNSAIDERYERNLYYAAFSDADKDEGVAAFLEKRTPDWPSVKKA